MIKPQEKIPNISIDLVNNTLWSLENQIPENFTILIFYRGKHCPVCKTYLEDLQDKISEFSQLGVNVIALSSDTEERAKETYQEWNIADIPLGYKFSIKDARDFGLYISNGIKDSEPKQFIEPALLIIRPDSTLYSVSIQSMPFARPDLSDILKGLNYIIENDYPARGEG